VFHRSAPRHRGAAAEEKHALLPATGWAYPHSKRDRINRSHPDISNSSMIVFEKFATSRDVQPKQYSGGWLGSARPPLSIPSPPAARRQGGRPNRAQSAAISAGAAKMPRARDRADAQRIARRVLDRAGEDRRAAVAAEGVAALVAAFGGLHVALRSTAAEHKICRCSRNVGTEGRAGQGLAVGAVADGDTRRIDLRLEADPAAMAASVDLHGFPPLRNEARHPGRAPNFRPREHRPHW
jgi:hypothetical protein